jgi:hypothetical protein
MALTTVVVRMLAACAGNCMMFLATLLRRRAVSRCCDDVGVEDGQFFLQLQRDGDVGFLYVLVGLEEDVVCALVVAVLLLLGGDGHCYFGCVPEVFEDAVESVGVYGVFGRAVCLAHEVVQQFLDQMFLR